MYKNVFYTHIIFIVTLLLCTGLYSSDSLINNFGNSINRDLYVVADADFGNYAQFSVKRELHNHDNNSEHRVILSQNTIHSASFLYPFTYYDANAIASFAYFGSDHISEIVSKEKRFIYDEQRNAVIRSYVRNGYLKGGYSESSNMLDTMRVEQINAVPMATLTETNNTVLKFNLLSMASATKSNNYTKVVVKRGDSLTGISQKYGVRVTTIAKINNLKSPYKIYQNQSLMIPTQDIVYHKVRNNESLLTISKYYNTSVNKIMKANKLVNSSKIHKGTQLIVPIGNSNLKENKGKSLSNVYHTVKNGESLSHISLKYKVTKQDIIRLNNISNPSKIRSGQRLLVKRSRINDNVKSKNVATVTHIVRRGENIGFIASKYGMKSSELMKVNKIKNPRKLKVGQKLVIKAGKVVDKKVGKIDSKSLVKRYHNVQNMETLISIAKKYDVASKEIALANNIKNPSSLRVGQKLIIPESIQTANNTREISHPKFIRPVSGNIIVDYGKGKNDRYNDGINIKAKAGIKVKASESGIVAYAGNELEHYGNLVIIKHSDNWITAYAHLRDIVVTKGQVIKIGNTIGHIGSTGTVSGSQLYFSIRKDKETVDPMKHIVE